MLVVNGAVSIPDRELEVRATRAGGPGGQHVNKSSTRIELRWNVLRTEALSAEQRARAREKLGARVDGEGYVRIVAAESRSQFRNRERAEARLAALLRDALAVPRARRKTRPRRAVLEARLREKKKRSEKKAERRRAPEE
ncbi:MAG: alternative ribosome rescue aminoacyl-tRNA hydrolase ArfB [Gemmatimonadaceae bacterium]